MSHLQIRCLQKLSKNSVSTVTTHSSQSNLDHDTRQAFPLHWEQNPDSLPEPHDGALWSSRAPLLPPRGHLSGLRPPGSPPPQLLPAVDQQWTQNVRPPSFMSLAPSLSPNFGLNVMSLNSADLMHWFICPFLICLPLPDSKVFEHRDPCDVTTCHRVRHRKHLASVSQGKKNGTSSPTQNLAPENYKRKKKIQGNI